MLTLDKNVRKPIPLPNGAVLPKARMTEREFVAWAYSDEDIRAEWVDGEVIVLPPSSIEHDDLLIWLYAILRPFVEHHDLGTILGPGVAVRFASQRRRRLPDVFFVSKSREDALRKAHIEGAPDLIIEVVSSESQSRDRRAKFLEYEKAGVREYWIIDPISQSAEAHTLKRGKYADIPDDGETLRSAVLPGFFLKSGWLWRKPRPSVLSVHRELGLQQG